MGKNSGNILLMILVAVGILAASIGGYFWWMSQKPKVEPAPVVEIKSKEASPSADEMVGWKTVTVWNKFKISYPPDWNIGGPPCSFQIISPEPIYSICFTTDSSGVTDNVKRDNQYSQNYNVTNVQTGEISIDGHRAAQRLFRQDYYGAEHYGVSTYIEEGNNSIIITGSTTKKIKELDDYNSLTTKIVSTIKFL